MRHFKAAASAAAIAITAAALSSFTAAAAEYLTPKYKDFNSNDVNGEIILEIPDGLSAEVKVTFDSPEVTGAVYYSEKLGAKGSYGFELEGRDTVEGDFRNYLLTVNFSGSDGAPYTAKLNIPDVNDNPDSFRKYTYTFTVDDEYTGKSWDEKKGSGEFDKQIAVHLGSVLLGDVDGDGAVNSADASRVLAEYSIISTGGSRTLTAKQVKAADVNGDQAIDSIDASAILSYYAITSTGGTPDWKEIIGK